MASPPLSELDGFAFVGSLDSNYHGVNVLDSASTNIVTSNAILSTTITNEFDNRVFRPVTLNNIPPNPNTISFQSSNGAIGNFGGAADVVVASSEKWY